MDKKKHSKMLMAAVLTAATYGVMTSVAYADPTSLVEAIADSTAASYTVNEALDFTVDAHTLGTLQGENRVFSITAGTVSTLDGTYPDSQKGDGATVESGQTLTIDGVSFTNFTTAITNAGTVEIVGTDDGIVFNANDNDIANSGTLNFTDKKVTLNSGISGNGGTTNVGAEVSIGDAVAHLILGNSANLVQQSLNVNEYGKLTATTAQLNGVTDGYVTNEGTINLAGTDALTVNINSESTQTGRVALTDDVTIGNGVDDVTVGSNSLGLNGHTMTLVTASVLTYGMSKDNSDPDVGTIIGDGDSVFVLDNIADGQIDITGVTFENLKDAAFGGEVKADASKLGITDVQLYEDSELTLVASGNAPTNTANYTSDGSVIIASTMANLGAFTNSNLTINALSDPEDETTGITFTTDADLLQTENAVVNHGTLVLTDEGTLSLDVTGDDGTTTIGANGNAANIVARGSIAQAINFGSNGSSLEIAANGVGGDVSMASGVELTLHGDYDSTEGDWVATTVDSFDHSILHENHNGTVNIAEELTITLGDNSRIDSSVVNNGTLTAAFGDATQQDATGLTSTLTNNNQFNLIGDLIRDITGAGTTTLEENETVKVAGTRNVAGTLELNGATLDMQETDLSEANPANVYSTTSANYRTLTVGNLTGEGNLKIDVGAVTNGSGAYEGGGFVSDKISITGDEDNNNATLTLTSINITEPTSPWDGDVPNGQINDAVTFLDGTTNNVEVVLGAGGSGIGTITSDGQYGHRYAFTAGSEAGKLNVIIRDDHIVTLAEFIQGGADELVNDDPEDITYTTYSLVDDYTTTENLGTMGTYVPEPSENGGYQEELNVYLNGHTLNGAAYAGATVDSGYTLNVDGTSDLDEGPNGIISGFTTAFTVNGEDDTTDPATPAGILNINNVTFTGNDVDIDNNGTVNFTGTNSLNTMTGTGDSNVSGGTLTVNENGSVEQDTINIAASGRLENYGDINATVVNRGVHSENYGTISDLDNYGFNTQNNGTITNLINEQGASLTNNNGDEDEPAGYIGSLENHGTVTNHGAWMSGDIPATIGDITANTGTINNGGNITGDVVNNEGGYVNNMTSGVIGGDGKTFTNEEGGDVLNYGTIASAVDNSGTITNQDDLDQAGLISGAVTNNAGGEIDNTLGTISGDIYNAAATDKVYADIPDGGTFGDQPGEYAYANGTDESDGYKLIESLDDNDNPVFEQLNAGYIVSNAAGLEGDVENHGILKLIGGDLRTTVTGEDGVVNVTGDTTIAAAVEDSDPNDDVDDSLPAGSITQGQINIGTPAVGNDPAVPATLTNEATLAADEINVEEGSELALKGSDSTNEIDKVNVNEGTVSLTDGAILDGNENATPEIAFTGDADKNRLVLNATNDDTELSGVNITADNGNSGYAVEANSSDENAVTIDNAIADATSITASDGTNLTLTKDATDSISGYDEESGEYNDSSENPQIVMGDGSSLTLDNQGEDNVINNNIVGSNYEVNIKDSEYEFAETELLSTIEGATDINASTDVVINAGEDTSTSDRIDGANLNLSDEAYATVATTADNFTIDNDVTGDDEGETLVLEGNEGIPESATNNGTQFTIAGNIKDVAVEVAGGELLLPNEDNLDNSELFIDDGGTLNTQNGSADQYNTPVSFYDGQFKIDANAVSKETDSFNNVDIDSGTAILTDVDVQDLEKVVRNTTKVDLKDSTGIGDNLAMGQELLDKKVTAMTPIRKMTASFSEDGIMTIAPSSGHNNWRDFNPAALATPVAAQLGGYLVQLNSYDEAFRNMDMYMLMTAKQRQALKFRNKMASIRGFAYDDTVTPVDSAAGWFRPYASFENVRLHNGPKVENNIYGSYFGGESSMKELGNGWDGLWGAYVGYNGAHQHFSNVSMYENGGTLGLVGMAYKDNFFVGGTINTGASAGEANTSFGSDDFSMLMAGAAVKAGYNWELAEGRFIIQPSMVAAYSFVNTFDYTNSAGVRINSDPLHAIMLEPGLKFIGNLDNGWQPYAGVSVVANLMDRASMKANDISLPSMSINPYVKYGVGVRKTWGDRFTGFLQTFFTSGGRSGVGFQGGFRWAIGQDGTHSMSDKAGKTPELKKTQVNLSSTRSSADAQARNSIRANIATQAKASPVKLNLNSSMANFSSMR